MAELKKDEGRSIYTVMKVEKNKIFRKVLTTALLMLLLTVAAASFSQTATISGKVPGVPGQLVRVIKYADQFSRLEKTLATTFTDSLGNFMLEVPVKETDYAFLAVGLKKGEFYLKPGAAYNFQILPDTISEKGSVFDQLPLQFELAADDGGLNAAIGDYNLFYNNFIYENSKRLYKGRPGQLIVGFEEKAKARFGQTDDPYFRDYMNYSFAWLEWIGMKNAPRILNSYFVNRPVLSNNIQYTEFFNDFIKSYMGSSDNFSYAEAMHAIASTDAIKKINELLKRDSLLVKDPTLRSLSAVLMLARKSNNPSLPKGRVVELLEEMKQTFSDKEISRIAGNFIEKLQRLAQGTPAPAFELEDQSGELYTLKEAEGKFVLLSFVKPDCKLCLNHLQLLNDMKEKFTSKLQLVTIVYGQDYRKLARFAESRLYEWPFLDLKKDILLLEQYEIKTYPAYTIINPDGTIAMTPAPMPDENLELYLIRMMVQHDNVHPKK